MKGKRYTTEQKIRILREAEEADATIIGVCQTRGISGPTRVWTRRCIFVSSLWVSLSKRLPCPFFSGPIRNGS